MSARFAPSGSRVALNVYFAHYLLRCDPLDQQTYALVGTGVTEQEALSEFTQMYPLRQTRRVPFGLPGDATNNESSLTNAGCMDLRSRARRLPELESAVKSPASGVSRYSLLWNESGQAGYVRAINDSTALIAFVQYTTSGTRTELAVRFEQHVLHCGWKEGDPWESAMIGVGGFEAEALTIRGTSAGRFGKGLQREAIVSSCVATAALRPARK